MTQIGTTALKRTLNLNDWLNTFAQYSLFGEFEGTDEFQDVIDDILEMLEETLTLEFIAELRNDEKFSEQAVDAIEDLYILMLEDDYEFELRMPSPKNQDRYWVFARDQFQVTQVTVYQLVEGIDFAIVDQAYGNTDDIKQYLPDEFNNYDYIQVVQENVQEDEVLTLEQWEELREEDLNNHYQVDETKRPNKEHIHQQCRAIMDAYPESREAMKCHKLTGQYRSVMAHMIAWPIAVFVVIFIIILIRSFRRQRTNQAGGNETPIESKKEATVDMPPNYNFVIQFPPEYTDVVKNTDVEKSDS